MRSTAGEHGKEEALDHDPAPFASVATCTQISRSARPGAAPTITRSCVRGEGQLRQGRFRWQVLGGQGLGSSSPPSTDPRPSWPGLLQHRSASSSSRCPKSPRRKQDSDARREGSDKRCSRRRTTAHPDQLVEAEGYENFFNIRCRAASAGGSTAAGADGSRFEQMRKAAPAQLGLEGVVFGIAHRGRLEAALLVGQAGNKPRRVVFHDSKRLGFPRRGQGCQRRV